MRPSSIRARYPNADRPLCACATSGCRYPSLQSRLGASGGLVRDTSLYSTLPVARRSHAPVLRIEVTAHAVGWARAATSYGLTMRIATWNMERLKKGNRAASAYDEHLRELRADVTVVTEPGSGFGERHPTALVAPELRLGSKKPEAWVAILGSSLDAASLEIPYKHLAVAGTTTIEGQRILIYGSVLPWLSARRHAYDVYGSTDRPFIDVFTTAIGQQVGDMRRLQALYPDHLPIWAGDFNHTIVPPFVSIQASAMIESALKGLGLRAYNATAPHREPEWHTIDLLCGPEHWVCGDTESSYPEYKGTALSDHRAYAVEIELPDR